MTSKTTNKYAPEVRERAVRMVLDHERDHSSRWAAVVSIQVERAEPTVERPVAIAVAPRAAVAGAFVPPRVDQAVDVGLNDNLQHALGNAAQEIAVSGLRHELGKG